MAPMKHCQFWTGSLKGLNGFPVIISPLASSNFCICFGLNSSFRNPQFFNCPRLKQSRQTQQALLLEIVDILTLKMVKIKIKNDSNKMVL
jgi:hypothetical protein